MRQQTFYLNEESDTCALGNALAHILQAGLKIYLYGDLGSGKTTLTRALLKAAGHQGKVKSPTYTLVESYRLTLNGQPTELLHFDLYRMGCADEFADAGFREHFNENTICVIEWADKADSELPLPDITVTFDVQDNGRTVRLEALSEKGSRCLENLRYSSRT